MDFLVAIILPTTLPHHIKFGWPPIWSFSILGKSSLLPRIKKEKDFFFPARGTLFLKARSMAVILFVPGAESAF